jgi:hypothetical protein
MENNPKKSRALIITLIAIVVLLVLGYIVFKKSDSIFGVKNSAKISKTFAPLLGTSRDTNNGNLTQTGKTGQANTNANQVNNTNTPQANTGSLGGTNTGNTGTLGGTIQGGDRGVSGISGLSAVRPAFNPIPSLGTANSAAQNSNTTLPDTNPDTTPVVRNPGLATESTSICPEDDPLVFTDGELVELNDLLRQYYYAAASMKTEDDIDVAENDLQRNAALSDQVAELARECRSQKSQVGYTGPQTVRPHPYYPSGTSNALAFTPSSALSQWIATSEYYQSGYGRPTISFHPQAGLVGYVIAGLGGTAPIQQDWPNAYRGRKIMNFKEFEELFRIW